MAKEWVCKCGHVNEPDDAKFSSHKCGLCGRDKWLLFYIGGGAAVVLSVLIAVVVFMLTYPESAYRSKFSELYANDALTPDGQELIADERAQLAALKKRFKLEDANVSAWEQEERARAGHDAYRETFSRLYANREAAAGNQITPAEREQLNQLAKDQRISPASAAAFETALVARLDQRAPRELITLLYEVYSDDVKSESEQSRLDDLARKHQVEEAQRAQIEREIEQRWRKAKPDFERGLRLSETRDYAGAAEAFRGALQSDGDNPWTLANLAAACLEAGQLAEAREAGEKALRTDPRNWLAHYNLGSWHARRGDKDDAISHLTTALGIVAEDRSQQLTKTDVASRMKTDESLRSLRQDPRFQQLLARQ